MRSRADADLAASGDSMAAPGGPVNEAPTRWFASHELRTPLNAILGSVELLIDGSLGPLSADAREAIGLVSSAARELGDKLDHLARLTMLEPRSADCAPVEVGMLIAAMTGDRCRLDDDRLLVEADVADCKEALSICRRLAESGPTEGGPTESDLARSIVRERPSGSLDVRLRTGLRLCRIAQGEGAILLETAHRLLARSGGGLEIEADGSLALRLSRATIEQDGSSSAADRS